MPDEQDLAKLRIEREPEQEGEQRSRWIAVGVLAAVVLVAGLVWVVSRPGAVKVRAAAVRAVDAEHEATVLNASGYVTARRQATVSSKVTGRVLEVLIEEGMVVEEGQLLARLDDSNVRVNLNLAEAELAAARAALSETRVRLDEARLELRRINELVESQIASQSEFDGAQAEVDSFVARLQRQEDEVEVAERGLALWRQQLEDTLIRSPFAGVVVSKNAQPGEMISPISAGGGFTRTGIGTVVDMSSLEIEVDVSESYINRVESGQPVEATLDAYPEWRIPCRVIAIVPTADRQKATVRVRIGFEELDPRILPDMGVKVAFREVAAAASPAAALVVPEEAVWKDGDRDVVWVIRNGTAERRAVTVGSRRDREVTILFGLTAGERVVIGAPEGLSEGDEVREVDG